MKRYTRKDINIKTQLHGKKFITEEDAASALLKLAELAIVAGADEDKLMEAMREKT